MAPKPSRDKKPKYMITYWCPHCQKDSGRTEQDEAKCFYCDRTNGLKEIKREKLTKEVMFNRIKTVTDRMMDNLRQAYDIRADDWPGTPEEEMILLEALAEGQDLQKAIEKIRKKK